MFHTLIFCDTQPACFCKGLPTRRVSHSQHHYLPPTAYWFETPLPLAFRFLDSGYVEMKRKDKGGTVW